MPDCYGKECGPDECGGNCGYCGAGTTCQAGECKEGPCEPDCAGKECGLDGCGGSCGTCGSGYSCENWICTFDGCVEGTCIANANCVNMQQMYGGGCLNEDHCMCQLNGVALTDPTECNNNTMEGYAGASCSGTYNYNCPAGYERTDCSSAPNSSHGWCPGYAVAKVTCEVEGGCVPSCSGKECGSNGCGGSCGSCSGNEVCQSGLCVEGSTGGWLDSATGLVWQKSPSPQAMSREEAVTYCNNLSLGGHSDWYLPSISELRSLIQGCSATETGGSCNISDNGCLGKSCENESACSGCGYMSGPDGGCYWPYQMEGSCSEFWYWSSSTVTADGGCCDGYPWHVTYSYAEVGTHYGSAGGGLARCVR